MSLLRSPVKTADRKPSSTFAEDYIPVSMVMDMDGKPSALTKRIFQMKKSA